MMLSERVQDAGKPNGGGTRFMYLNQNHQIQSPAVSLPCREARDSRDVDEELKGAEEVPEDEREKRIGAS